MVVHLIAKDKHEKLQYEERCKLMIDSISKLLLVEPFIEEYKMISAMFKWQFVALKNILFVFAEHDFQDFALVFDDTRKCNKIYDILVKKGAISGSVKLIKDRFLPSFFTEISKDNESSIKLKEIILKWIEKFDGKEKEEYIQILKDYNIYDLIYPEINRRKRKAIDFDENKKDAFYKFLHRTTNLRKDGNGQNSNDTQNCVDLERFPHKKRRKRRSTKEFVAAPFFEIFSYVDDGIEKKVIYIFPTADKKCYYQYHWREYANFFGCISCGVKKKHLSAKIIKRNGKNIVLMEKREHFCEPKEFKGIIEKPNFEVFLYDHKKGLKKWLILFTDASRINCFQYSWVPSLKQYRCVKCSFLNHSNLANIYKRDNGTEILMLKSSHHNCEIQKFNPEKFGKKDIIEDGNFKIFHNFQNGVNRSKLVIFVSADKSTCYEYAWSNGEKKFFCCGCKSKNKGVTVEVCQDSDNKDFLKLSKKRHICEPREYDPQKFEISEEIIEDSNFKIFQYQHNGVLTSRLILFCSTNKNLCYEYYRHKQYYTCCYCPLEKQITATVCKNENGMDYLSLCKSEHVCDLREFDPDKFKDDKIVEKSLYKITSTVLRTGAKKKHLIIFTSVEKRYYHKYAYDTYKKKFWCTKCKHQTITKTAFVHNEGQENECVYESSQKHVCEPEEYTHLVDDSIVEAPNFQLVKRKANGKVISKLAVFSNDEKSECYEYTWCEKDKYFICNRCTTKHKTYVYAKLIKNDENQECVQLNKISHKCEPIKFIPEDLTSRVIKMLDFKLWEDGKKKKLIIFDSKNRKMGYIYVYRPNTKNYVCTKCNIQKKKYVTAKLCKDENGENYFELNDAEHICIPIEYSQLLDIKIIETQNFQLVKRKVYGKIFQRMVVFTNDEKKECYEYTWCEKDKYFICYPCSSTKHKTYVYAKLIKNDKNEECVQLCKKPHKCEPIKFLPENIATKIVKQQNFKLWEDSSKKKRLTIYDNKNPKLGYIFVYCPRAYKYICTKCNSQKKRDVTAKLCKDENGEIFVELSDAEHVCKMQKL